MKLTETSKIVTKILDSFNEQIRDRLDEDRVMPNGEMQHMTTTGKAKNSIEVQVTESTTKWNFKSVGVDYLEMLDKGRGPGKYPPKGVILEWGQKKFSDFTKSDAGLVNKMIKEKGTLIFRDNSLGLQLDEKIVTLKEQLSKVVDKSIIFDVTKELNFYLNKYLKKKNDGV
jgi:hypothetical protein